MKKILILLVLGLALASCNNNKKNNVGEQNNTTNPVEQSAGTEIPPDIHTSENALDYGGTYKGIIPCGDCPGIEVVITLNYQGNYTKKMTYLDKEPDNVFISEGRYTWNEQGNKITFAERSGPEIYLVGENRLFMLDKEGNRITGDFADKYIMEQVEKR